MQPELSVPLDPEVPALGLLLGPDAASLLAAVLEASDGRLRSHRISQVRYVPGVSVTAQYRCDVTWKDGRPTTEAIVAMAGIDVPDGTTVFAAEGLSVAVWRFPHDPFLPGLALAADPEATASLLESLGAPPGRTRLRTRAYRAGRRAVIEVTSPTNRLFLKVMRPDRTAPLQDLHVRLAEVLPVPRSYGWSHELGLVVLQAIEGRTLRDAVTARISRLPSAETIEDLLDRLPPDPGAGVAVPGPGARVEEFSRFLGRVMPELSARLEPLADRLASGPEEPTVPVHGDFHSSQLLVTRDQIVGLVDVDTAGNGSRTDDLAALLGHLATLALSSRARKDTDAYGSRLIDSFDRSVDPAALRRRTAAVVLGLATGPFRVQEPQWRRVTEQRISLAEKWADSAEALS